MANLIDPWTGNPYAALFGLARKARQTDLHETKPKKAVAKRAEPKFIIFARGGKARTLTLEEFRAWGKAGVKPSAPTIRRTTAHRAAPAEAHDNGYNIIVRDFGGVRYSPVVVGLAVTWDDTSYLDDWSMKWFAPGAFVDSIARDKVVVGIGHGSPPFASTSDGTLRLWESNRGLEFECNPSDTSAGREAVSLLENNGIRGVSIRAKYDPAESRITEAALMDVSLVTRDRIPRFAKSTVSLRWLELVD